MTGTGAKKLSQISWSTSSTGYPRIDTRIDTKTTQGKPVVFSSNGNYFKPNYTAFLL